MSHPLLCNFRCSQTWLVTGITPHLLDTQYRMHPSIAAFPSAMFYGNRLKTGLTPQERPLPAPIGKRPDGIVHKDFIFPAAWKPWLNCLAAWLSVLKSDTSPGGIHE